MTEERSTSEHADPERAREFASAFRAFLEWIHEPRPGRGNAVSALVHDFLGPAAEQSVVTREFSPFEHVNLQTAINAWSAQSGRTAEVRGIALPPHFGGVSLQQLTTGDGLPPISLSAPAFADLPNGPESTLACLQLALLLVTDDTGRYVLMISGPVEHENGLELAVAGLSVPEAQATLSEIDALRTRLNVYRGHLLEVVPTMTGVSLNFSTLPPTPRRDVVLPEPVLQRIERHALGVAEHRAALLAVGQHLKRGLLMFGPPGTGKTHTMRYLVSHMPGYTRLLLAGRSLHAIGEIAHIARELEPAVVVLEDVDLVAEDRSFGPSGNPVLFELLDAMDGAATDADLLFLLTTNRADLLEAALAARPGRVDVAVEIGLPDAPARRRLLELYSRGVPLRLEDAEMDAAVARMEGVTASFLKELVRRAVLEAVHDDPTLAAVTGPHVDRALDDLLDSSQQVTRTLLGVGFDPEELPSGGIGPGPMGGAWFGRPRPGVMYRRAWRQG